MSWIISMGNTVETLWLTWIRGSNLHRSIADINKSCLEEFRKHWTCLEDNNQQLWQCRPAEWKLNKCVFENLVSDGRYPFITSTIHMGLVHDSSRAMLACAPSISSTYYFLDIIMTHHKFVP